MPPTRHVLLVTLLARKYWWPSAAPLRHKPISPCTFIVESNDNPWGLLPRCFQARYRYGHTPLLYYYFSIVSSRRCNSSAISIKEKFASFARFSSTI